jgi:hypothetical protein
LGPVRDLLALRAERRPVRRLRSDDLDLATAANSVVEIVAGGEVSLDANILRQRRSASIRAQASSPRMERESMATS